MADQLTITRMIDRFEGRDSLRTVVLDVLEQFCLCIGGPRDQDHTGIGNRLSHPLEKVVIFLVGWSGCTTSLSASEALKWNTRASR